MRLQACSGLIRSHQAGSGLSRPGHFSGLTTHACSCLISADHIFPGWYINIWRGKKKKINWQRQKYRNNKKETAKRNRRTRKDWFWRRPRNSMLSSYTDCESNMLKVQKWLALLTQRKPSFTKIWIFQIIAETWIKYI